MAKRNLNWTEIEIRYKAGEQPADIAKDYRDCTRQKISQKACRAGWTQAKEEICNRIASEALQSASDELKELCNVTTRVHLNFMRKLHLPGPDGTTLMDQITNPYLFDGEKVNSLFQTAMNNSTKIMLALYGKDEDVKKAVDTIVVKFDAPTLNQGGAVVPGDG